MEGFISRFSSSEGENITINLAGLGSRLIKFIKDGDNGDKIAKLARSLMDAPEPKSTSDERWILLDAIDSGLSIDGILDFKEYLIKPLLSMIDDPDNLYIVIAANNYELARSENTFDVVECKYVSIESYKNYRNVIINSRKYKDI